MSDFQRNLFLQRIKQEEARLGVGLAEEEEEDEVAPLPSVKPRSQPAGPDVNTVPWNSVFTHNTVLDIDGYRVRSYFLEPAGSDHPVIFVGHHGAG